MADIFQQPKEQWSWLKFIKGPFDGKNYAKAIVMLICMSVIITIIGAVAYTAWTFIIKPRQTHQQTNDTRIGGNVGELITSDNHSTTNESHYHFPLSDLFTFGSKAKKVSDD